MSAPASVTHAGPDAGEQAANGTQRRRRHLYELDVVRGVTMVGVVGVHSLSFTTNPTSWSAGAFTIMLHFTRESFFMLMGFVLVFARRDHPTTWGAFWRKRFPLVAVPYVAWSAIYVYWPGGGWKSPWHALHSLEHALINGTAWYHLYFLLVTLQIYLLFPLIIWLVRVTRRHHVAVVVTSLAVQLVAMGLAQYGPTSRGAVGGWFWAHSDSLVISYQFYVVAGAVAGWHADDLVGWFAAHRKRVLLAAAGAAVITQLWFFAQLWSGESVRHAYAVFQPAEVIWSIAAIALLVVAGTWWADRRRAGRTGPAIPILSRYSFGMFLVHPLVLYWLIRFGYVGTLRGWLPDLVTYLIVYPTVVTIALALAAVASRTPVSMPLTGRPRVRPRRTPVGSEA